MRITGRGIWGEPRDHGEAIAVLRRAVQLGITLIDTADSYGPEVSERLIAEALHPYPDGLTIATKGGLVRPGPDQWVESGRPEHLRRACEGSLRRLKLDRKSTRLNSSHLVISYAVFCLKKKSGEPPHGQGPSRYRLRMRGDGSRSARARGC